MSIDRKKFHKALQEHILLAEKSSQQFALVFIDIDNLKHINYSYGYDIGDTCITEIIKRLQSVLNLENIYRIDGDEFAVIVDLAHKNIKTLPKMILDSMKEPLHVAKEQIECTISIGIGLYKQDASSCDELIKCSDIALFGAKKKSGNSYQFFEKFIVKQIEEKNKTRDELYDALINNEFLIYFQPQYNVKNNTIIGMEALIRWKHPTKGFIPPDKFIPIAEKSDLIIKIDEYVMRSAMRQFLHWKNKNLNPGVLSLNLSPRQLSKENYLQRLQTILKEEKFNPQSLKLEMLERDVMSNPQESIEKLYEIRDMGIAIAIDDFGTGYSSLSYLKKLPLTTLKIDRTFIKDIPLSEDDMAICRAIIALAESLDLDLIAEGVEEKEQIKFLLENGCDVIQGYYFSKPVVAQEIETLLVDMNAKKVAPVDIEIESKNLLEYAKEVAVLEEKLINHEIPVKLDDGSTMWLKEKIVPLYDDDDNLISSIIVRYDVTHEKDLEKLVTTDALTKLNNRRSFNTMIVKKINEYNKEGKTLAFMMIDVDNFKKYNDSYGHQAGDNVLSSVAASLESRLKKGSDFAFRLGGEEFGILFEPLNVEKALAFAQNVVKDVRELNMEHVASEVCKYVTISAGLLVVDFSQEFIDSQGFYTMADDALYQAKDNGKNKVILYENEDVDFF